MIEQLETPEKREGKFGPVTLTHRAWGFTFQPWNDPPIMSYSVLGVVKPDGTFAAFTSSEDYQAITGDDYATLLAPTKDGKAQDVFRTTDVIATHEVIAERKAAAAKNAESTASGSNG